MLLQLNGMGGGGYKLEIFIFIFRFDHLKVYPSKEFKLLVENFVFAVILLCTGRLLSRWSFSQTHKIGNIGIIANFVFRYACSFNPYLHCMMLVNVKLDISGYSELYFKVADYIGPVYF